jgi:hypothetical protein
MPMPDGQGRRSKRWAARGHLEDTPANSRTGNARPQRPTGSPPKGGNDEWRAKASAQIKFHRFGATEIPGWCHCTGLMEGWQHGSRLIRPGITLSQPLAARSSGLGGLRTGEPAVSNGGAIGRRPGAAGTSGVADVNASGSPPGPWTHNAAARSAVAGQGRPERQVQAGPWPRLQSRVLPAPMARAARSRPEADRQLACADCRHTHGVPGGGCGLHHGDNIAVAVRSLPPALLCLLALGLRIEASLSCP